MRLLVAQLWEQQKPNLPSTPAQRSDEINCASSEKLSMLLLFEGMRVLRS